MKLAEAVQIFDFMMQKKSKEPVSQLEIRAQEFLGYCLQKHHFSEAQLFQDLYVAFRLNGKSNGFFVEFGACDGVHLSNTYLLEKTLAWRGVVAEPWPAWHQTLRAERTCLIETRCVWSSSGATIKFSGISKDPVLSTASELLCSDLHANERKAGGQEEIEVETISLNDLLHNAQAPRDLDYLSMDTEGSELRILESLDFSRWQPKIITVEHNYSEQREQIYRLLSAQGYGRELEPFSKWDDWYFHPSIAAAG